MAFHYGLLWDTFLTSAATCAFVR